MLTKKFLAILICVVLFGGSLVSQAQAVSDYQVKIFTASKGTAEHATESVNSQIDAFFDGKPVVILSTSVASAFNPRENIFSVTVGVAFRNLK